MKIGMLVVATNKYIRLVEQLLKSADSHFLSNHEVEYFIFTDQSPVNIVSDRKVTYVSVEHEPWPAPALKKYDYFYENCSYFQDKDFLFHSDVDMRFVDTVGDEILNSRVATIHPGFFNSPISRWSYESRKESTAYIPSGKGDHYYAGAFVGGNYSEFIQMARTISEWRKIDELNKLIPVWHDESLMNKYYYENKPTLVLDSSYCYPEGWKIPFRQRILALNKNHKEMRS